MGYFNDKIDALMNSEKGTEEKTREVIMMLDECIFEPMMHENKDKYWWMMRKIHEIYDGCHYDEGFALWEVEQMHHTSKDGVHYKGEHWSLEQVQNVFNSYKDKLQAEDNVYDMYVALNANWHDKICMFKDWFTEIEIAENKVIEDAITAYFMDEDATNGKIWHYMNAVRKM